MLPPDRPNASCFQVSFHREAGAHNALLDLEELDDTELERIRSQYEDLAAAAREELSRGNSDTRVEAVEPEAGA